MGKIEILNFGFLSLGLNFRKKVSHRGGREVKLQIRQMEKIY